MSQNAITYETFTKEIATRNDELASLLPQDVPVERFKASAIAAVRKRTDLLQATPRSLFAAVTEAAQDGIIPDGRDGVILDYNTKVRYRDQNGNWRDRWERQAKWLPMVPGLRKRARKLDGIIVSAEVVYQNDFFVFSLGDDPSLEHKPPTDKNGNTLLGADRGEPTGVYAIYRLSGEILHREIMSADEVETVRAKSRNPDGLLWKDFWTEAWKKTVIRRGFKSIPVGQDLERIIERDDTHFDFDGTATVVEERTALPREVPSGGRRSKRRREPVEVVTGQAKRLPADINEDERPNGDPDGSENPAPDGHQDFLDEMEREQGRLNQR